MFCAFVLLGLFSSFLSYENKMDFEKKLHISIQRGPKIKNHFWFIYAVKTEVLIFSLFQFGFTNTY